jgi:PKD repeat protein
MVKKIIYLFLLFSALSKAQNGFFINGNDASLSVESSGTLSVDGDFRNLDCNPTNKVLFFGALYLTGNLVNNDPLSFRASTLATTADSRLVFINSPTSPSSCAISGSVIPEFWIVDMNKPGNEVVLQTNVRCYDKLYFNNGFIKMNNRNWVMKEGTGIAFNSPGIVNENPNSMFIAAGFNDIGKVIFKTAYPTASIFSPGNIGIQLSGAMPNGDSINIIRGFSQQVNSAKTSILRYFDIYSPTTSSVSLNPLSIKVNYFNNDLLYFAPGYLNLSSLKLYASPNADNNWSMLPSTVQNTLVALPPLAGAMTASLSDLAMPTVSLNNTAFRITIADPNCLTPPVSALVLDTVHICAGNTMVLDAGNSGGSVNNWLWTTIPTSTTTLYTQTISVTPNVSFQKYTVELKNSNGCVTKDTVVVAPTAPIPFVKYFNHLNSCLGDSITIKDTVTITSGTFTNTWAFSDATTSNSQLNLFKKKFALAGNHTIQLTSTSNYGCTVVNTATTVIVYPAPSVAFTHSLNCGTGIVSFSNTSVSNFSAAVITSIGSLWNLGLSPTNTAVGLTASQNYSANGTYTIKLVSATSLGCKDSITSPIIIYPSNVTAFAKNNACLGDTVYFNNSTACNTGSCSYQWSFGDNTNSPLASPKKVYSTPGLFTVKLKVTNPLGCPDSLTKQVFVNPKPNAAFTGTNTICINNFAYFNNTSSITSGSITSYLWNFNNAVTSTSLNGASNFSVAGVYNVSLTTTSDSGCVSTFIQSLNVRPQPVAQYVVNNACFGTPSQFVSTSSGTGLSYIWQYGNGVITPTLTNSNQNYTYPALGTYASSLIAINVWGCSDTATVSTSINPSPTLALGGNVATCGTTYSVNAGNPGSTYVWQPGNQTSQSIVITTNGSYQVAVTNTNGCTAAQSVSVTLNTNVKPQLGNDTTVCGPRVLNAGYPLSSYLWNNALTTQTILATASGSFEVRVTDQNGCIGRDTINLIVNTPAQVSLGVDYTNCKPKFGLVLTPTTSATTYSWSSGALTSSLIVTNNGPYWVQVTATNGCKARDTINVSFLQTPVANLGPDKSVCGSTLLDALNIGSTYLWNNNSLGQTLNVTTSGAYFVTITNPSNSCFQKDTINVSVNPLVNVFLGNDTTYCNNSSYVLNAGNAGATYSWTSGQTTPTISVASSGIYGVMVTNAGGCSSSDYITVTLVGAPIVNLGSNIRYLCGNNAVPLGVANIGTINWNSNVGFTATSPSVTINQPGKYWVDVSNFGCTASDSVLVVTTTNTIQAIFLASTTDTINKPIQFVNLSQPLPTSNLWDFGDGLTSTDYSPLHTYYLPQTFSVTLEVSNGFCTDKLTKALSVIFRNGAPIIYQPTDKLEVLNFSVYPNPSNNYLQIDFALNDYAPIELQLFDLTGRLVAQRNDDSQMIYSTQLDISEFKNGLYILNVNAKSLKGNIRKTSKVVKID